MPGSPPEVTRTLELECGLTAQWFEVLVRLVRSPGHRSADERPRRPDHALGQRPHPRRSTAWRRPGWWPGRPVPEDRRSTYATLTDDGEAASWPQCRSTSPSSSTSSAPSSPTTSSTPTPCSTAGSATPSTRARPRPAPLRPAQLTGLFASADGRAGELAHGHRDGHRESAADRHPGRGAYPVTAAQRRAQGAEDRQRGHRGDHHVRRAPGAGCEQIGDEGQAPSVKATPT